MKLDTEILEKLEEIELDAEHAALIMLGKVQDDMHLLIQGACDLQNLINSTDTKDDINKELKSFMRIIYKLHEHNMLIDYFLTINKNFSSTKSLLEKYKRQKPVFGTETNSDSI